MPNLRWVTVDVLVRFTKSLTVVTPQVFVEIVRWKDAEQVDFWQSPTAAVGCGRKTTVRASNRSTAKSALISCDH